LFFTINSSHFSVYKSIKIWLKKLIVDKIFYISCQNMAEQGIK